MYNQMVIRTDLSDADVDRLFRALADATRRDIVTRVFAAPQSVSTLAEQYSMTFPAVHKHVSVLEGAGLVTKQRRGREQVVHGNIDAIHRARELLDQFEELWRGRITRMEAILDSDPGE